MKKLLLRSIIIDNKKFTVGDKVWQGINKDKKNQKTFVEGYVCFGKFSAEIYTCYGFYVGNKQGKQLSEAGLDSSYIVIERGCNSKQCLLPKGKIDITKCKN